MTRPAPLPVVFAIVRPAPSGGTRSTARYPARMPQDYSGEHLQGRSFAFHDLTGADFSGAHLQGETFWKADLFGANFTDADLTDAFRRPGISRADMEGVIGLDSITGLVD